MQFKTLVSIIIITFTFCSGNCFAQGKVSRTPQQQVQPSKPKTSTPKVTVSEPDGYINGHGYVDLGLPSGAKWATCNIGASSPTEYGDYFAWGEITVTDVYSASNCFAYGKTISEMKKDDIINSSNILNKEYDAAHNIWGDSWRMPTRENCEELIGNCKWDRAVINGKRGHRIVGPNGKSIFLPEAGYKIDQRHNNAGMSGHIRCSTVNTGTNHDLNLHFDKYSVEMYVGICRLYDGQSIRPVLE